MEQNETQHWLDTALDCGYCEVETVDRLRRACEGIGRLLGGMIAKADSFCGNFPKTLRESAPEYFGENSDY